MKKIIFSILFMIIVAATMVVVFASEPLQYEGYKQGVNTQENRENNCPLFRGHFVLQPMRTETFDYTNIEEFLAGLAAVDHYECREMLDAKIEYIREYVRNRGIFEIEIYG